MARPARHRVRRIVRRVVRSDPAAAARARRRPDPGFLTGDGIAARCGHVLNRGPFTRNRRGRAGWYFCKTDFVEEFFAEHAPDEGFVLFTHNSDSPIDERYVPHLGQPALVAWYAANPDLVHPKLRALPAGIANPMWPHGDARLFRRVQAAALPKRTLFDVSFSVGTNPTERLYCLEQTRLEPAPPRPFEPYLHELASSYFCISPRGNGIDCHRTWEALYLRTVPVVTRSVLTEQHPELPLVVLDDWADFRGVRFTPELYEALMGGWSPDRLALDTYLAEVTQRATRAGRRPRAEPEPGTTTAAPPG
jgi:hypothetical protein